VGALSGDELVITKESGSLFFDFVPRLLLTAEGSVSRFFAGVGESAMEAIATTSLVWLCNLFAPSQQN
jgi:hypothetical protein